MTIERDGKTYELTDEEIRFIIAAEHEKDIRYEYAEAVSRCEEENWISFESWSECSFGTYASENEAREDFIDKLTEDYLEQEELYERMSEILRLHLRRRIHIALLELFVNQPGALMKYKETVSRYLQV